MIGYIYITRNNLDNKFYIGKHISSYYDKNYYGSGTYLNRAIKKYGKKNFTNEIIDTAETLEELDEKEKFYIAKYRYMDKENCYNIANGGDGGDTFTNKSEEEKQEFLDRITKINQERFSIKEFKEKLSIATKRRYENIEEREKQSIKIRKSWSNEKLRKEQSERLKNYFKNNPKDNSYLNIPYIIEYKGEILEFESQKFMVKYFKENFGITPSRDVLRKAIELGKERKSYIYQRNRGCDFIEEMIIYQK